MLSRRAAVVFGVANLLTGALVGVGVFVALPSRWWPVDLAGGVLAALEVSAGAALLASKPWAERVARAACAVALVLGLFAVTMLAVTASWLAGVYGPIGRGGAIVLVLVGALALPYTVVLPVVQLVWLGHKCGRSLTAWLAATAAACLGVHRALVLDVDEGRPRAVVASVWRHGERVARAVLARPEDRDAPVDAASADPAATRVLELVVAEGPVPAWPAAALALSFVPGQDGLVARLAGRTAYVTPDDLLAMQAYDHGLAIPSIQLTAGLDLPLVLAKAADDLGVSVHELVDRGTLRRVRVVRTVVGRSPVRGPSPEHLTADDVHNGMVAMARYLARGVDADGRFRYLVDAPTNRTRPGYDWARHAGATYFLAQAAAFTADGDLAYGALRAAGLLRDRATARCGERACIGDGHVADVGSTALAVLAFVQLARAKLDEGYALVVPPLTAFLRSQQRADGELRHLYDRAARRPIDVQLMYFSGEAAFALSRAHCLTGDPRDLDAATRILARLVGPGWNFFGSRYYYGEEHWTCQAMADLWDRAPNIQALDFCLAWQAYERALMYGPGETLYDADGAYGLGPVMTPRLTHAASRAEAGLATLDIAIRAGRPAREIVALEGQVRRSVALLLRHQLRAAESSPSAHLFVDPAAIDGAMPASEVDWQLRIDYDQHAGSALIRWLEGRDPVLEGAKAPNSGSGACRCRCR